MSGEGLISSRPDGAPHAHSRCEGLRSMVVTRLCADGQHRVCLMVPALLPFGSQLVETLLEPDTAELLARELLEYAALVRDKIGLPGGKAMP